MTRRSEWGNGGGASLALLSALVLGACGGGGGGPGGSGDARQSLNTHFTGKVQPQLQICRSCHVPDGVADVENGRDFMLASTPASDLEHLKASWQRLGGNNPTSRILLMASAREPHTGGALWPADSAAYRDMALLLRCFADEANCGSILAGGGGGTSLPQQPLLGSSRGGHIWYDFCQGKGDEALLPPDPRSLVQPGVNQGKAVHFNMVWKDCHVDPQLVGERPHPKTCGEFRESYARGERLMRGHGHEGAGSFFAGDTGRSGVPASNYNQLWRIWGLTERPKNFDQLVSERYGMPMGSERNPYPLPGEDANATDGGSGQLSIFMTQLRGENGEWTGQLGFTCHACHSGAAGLPEEGAGLGPLLGSGNPLHDIGLMARDIGLIGAPTSSVGLAFSLFGASRGTNNAQFGNIVGPPNPAAGDPPTQAIGWLTSGSTASMDTPAWWNLGHRPLKFIDAVVPTDAVRVDLAFYGPLGGDGRWVRDHAQAADHYIMSVKAPKYPLDIDTPLAEQGAILFHTKDLWAPNLANPIPRPQGGNGSCASCHGAYSPRFVHDPAFLDTPALEGIASYNVPISIIRTDRERLDAFNEDVQQSNGGGFEGYPETVGTAQDCGSQNRAELRGDREPGYLAPPLYGVWATAPYLHNGSVPDVWTLLKPEARPKLWRRVSAPAPAGQQGQVAMGFDTSIRRAYDPERMGWKYEDLSCGVGTLPYVDCNPDDASSKPAVQQLLAQLYGNLLLAWNVGNAGVYTQWTPQQIEDRKIYNTYWFSQSAEGHDFTSVLTDRERRALIEYLKTL